MSEQARPDRSNGDRQATAEPARVKLGAPRMNAVDASRSLERGRDAQGSPDVESIVDNLERTVVFRFVQPAKADGEARMAYVSRNVERIFGVSVEAVLNDSAALNDLIEPAALPEFLTRRRRAFSNGQRLDVTVPFVITRGDVRGRRIFRIDATARPGEGAAVWNGVLTDCTDEAERNRLTEVIEVSPDLIGTVDASGRISYLNRAGHAMLGLDWSSNPDDRIAEVGVELLHPPEMQTFYWKEIVPAVKRDGVWSGETEIVNRHGRRIPVSQVVVAHRGPSARPDRAGPITHLSTIIRDMSARTEMEDRLRSARRASETARDAAEMARAHAENMTHEVNHRVKNLFSLVPAIVQLSSRSTNDVKVLVRIVRERIAALVRSHELTLNENGELTGVALRDLLSTVLTPYEGACERASFDGPDVRINAADGNALSLVLHELTTNAAKYGALSRDDGSLRVTWRTSPREGMEKGPQNPEEDTDTRWTVLDLTWHETLPGARDLPTKEPERRGFGTLLLERLVQSQMGRLERVWRDDGLTVSLHLPVHGARASHRRR